MTSKNAKLTPIMMSATKHQKLKNFFSSQLQDFPSL